MRPIPSKARPTLAALGICSALGLAAAPMAHVWLTQEKSHDEFYLTDNYLMNGFEGSRRNIVVDLRDDTTDADVADIERKTGIDLVFASSFSAKSDKVMEAQVSIGIKAWDTIASLRKDSRVEVAEAEVMYSLPPVKNSGDPEASWEAAKAEARSEAAQRSESLVSPSLLATIGAPSDATGSFTMTCSGPEAAFSSTFKPNDPRYNEQWNLQMVGAEDAWKKSTGKGVIVAIIDTGVSAGPTKKGKPVRDFGTTHMVPGYDFVSKDSDPYDDHGHGTHVAGTVAEATNNNEGVAGLAFDASIMPLKVLSAQGSGSSADIANAIRWAADHGANVINMSLGSSVPSEVIRNACKYAKKKNVVIVCAAGNGSGEPVGYPAAFPECIAVSSVGPTGNLAFYSSYGKQVALAAPGGDTTNGKQDGILQNTNFPEDQGGKGDDYYFFQGTSMASPHVAAVAALIEAQGVTDAARVKEILTSSATPKGEKKKYGAGILSAAGATDKAAAQVGPNPFQFLVAAMAGVLLTMGVRRRYRSGMLRGAMVGALLIGFFVPDWFAARVGADSAWNLLTFSALLPLGLLLVTRRSGALIKVAGAASVGVVMAIAHDVTVGAVPFTTATFGESALPWIYTNLGLALSVMVGVAARAYRATRAVSLR